MTGAKAPQTLARQSLALQDAGAKHRSRFIQRLKGRYARWLSRLPYLL